MNLDGSDLRLITPDAADHDFAAKSAPLLKYALRSWYRIPPSPLSPSGAYVVDTYSTTETPSVTDLRRTDGTLVMRLEAADVKGLATINWSPPKSFTVKAADGVTDLYGVMVLPKNFDPSKRYAVVDVIYNGPQVVTTPHDFNGFTLDGRGAMAESFAQMGYVAVIMDSRGTPMRSRAFQDYSYNNFEDFGLADHVAGLKELASRHAFMDLNRVGVFGHSFGGYATMRAILGHPDFFKVAAASAGPYDPWLMYSLDAFFAPPRYGQGGDKPQGPKDRPTNWGQYDQTALAAQLKGKLLIGYGDLDENAYPAATAKMIQALIAADKPFDLIYMPNRPHGFSAEGYFIRRRWDFFARNLPANEN